MQRTPYVMVIRELAFQPVVFYGLHEGVKFVGSFSNGSDGETITTISELYELYVV